MSALPEKKTAPREHVEDYLWLLYGVPKIGKSTFCSQMNEPFFIATEPGLNALSVYAVFPKTWEEVLETGAELDKSDRFGTVVLDTVDNAYQMAMDYTCKLHNIKHPQDLEYGKGWHLVNTEFQRVINKLAQSRRGLVLVSHSQDITIKTRTAEISKSVPTLSGGARKFTLGLSDIILYAEMVETKEGITRTLHAAPSENWEAGDRTGRLPSEMPLDWKIVSKAFENGAKTSKVTKDKGAPSNDKLC